MLSLLFNQEGVTEISFVGSATNSATSGTSFTITLPTCQEGDVVFVFGCESYAGDITARLYLSDSGYSALPTTHSNDTYAVNPGLFWKRMGSTPDTEVVVNTTAAGYGFSALAYVLRGVDPNVPFDVTPVLASGTDSAVPDPGSITPITAGAWVLAFGASSYGDAAITAPSGYSNAVSVASAASSPAACCAVASKTWISGAEDPGAWTDWSTTATNAWSAVTVAVRPAAVVDPPHILRVGSATNAAASGTSVTVTLPTCATDDIIVVAVSNTGFFSGDRNLSISTAGYTELADLYSSDISEANLGVYWKRVTNPPDTTVVCTTSSDTGYGLVAVASVFRGVDTATAIDVSSTTATGVDSGLPNAPSITPTTGGALVVVCGGGSLQETGLEAPVGYENHNISEANGSTYLGCTAVMASKYWTSGAEDPAVWTSTYDSTNTAWCAVTLALRPAEAVVTATGDLDATESGSDTAAFEGTVETVATGTLAATETGGDTAAFAGDVLIDGALAATETGADTAALAGDVLIDGTLAATEAGADTAAIEGTSEKVAVGSLAATETGADTAAFAGDVFISGTLAAVETGADTTSFAGTVLVEGSFAAVETGADTAAFAGDVYITGTLTATESGADICLMLGDVVVTGSLTAQESGSDSAAFAGDVVVQGVLSAIEMGEDVFVGTGPNVITGTMSAVEVGADTIAVLGSVSGIIETWDEVSTLVRLFDKASKVSRTYDEVSTISRSSFDRDSTVSRSYDEVSDVTRIIDAASPTR